MALGEPMAVGESGGGWCGSAAGAGAGGREASSGDARGQVRAARIAAVTRRAERLLWKDGVEGTPRAG